LSALKGFVALHWILTELRCDCSKFANNKSERNRKRVESGVWPAVPLKGETEKLSCCYVRRFGCPYNAVPQQAATTGSGIHSIQSISHIRSKSNMKPSLANCFLEVEVGLQVEVLGKRRPHHRNGLKTLPAIQIVRETWEINF